MWAFESLDTKVLWSGLQLERYLRVMGWQQTRGNRGPKPYLQPGSEIRRQPACLLVAPVRASAAERCGTCPRSGRRCLRMTCTWGVRWRNKIGSLRVSGRRIRLFSFRLYSRLVMLSKAWRVVIASLSQSSFETKRCLGQWRREAGTM